MTGMLDGEEEFTELVDADFPRIDLVNKGANGVPFLIAKSAGGLLPPDTVRALAGPAEQPTVQPAPVAKGDDGPVTVTGSPAAIARMIHEAAIRTPVTKAATPEPPARAADEAPTTPGADGSAQEDSVSKEQQPAAAPVAKADGPDLDTSDVVADAGGGSTADTVPGSPDWEQRDADTAMNAVSVLGRVKAAVEWLSGREATEAVTADSDDAYDSMNLAGIADMLDAIIRDLGGFAAAEALATEVPDEVEEIVEKAAGPLSVLERFAPVVKAGRVLSSANEAAIRQASDSLQKVLASLPAPVTDDQPVAKEEAVHDTTPAPAATPVETQPVEKAKGDPQMAVFDENGKLVGTIDPTDLSPIAAPSTGSDDTAAAADTTADASTDAAAAPAAPVQPADDGTVIPGTDTVAAPAQPGTDDDQSVQKSQADGSVLAAAFKEALAPLMERIGATADLAGVVKGLEERVSEIAKMPDDRKSPLLNGSTSGSVPAADGQLVELQKAVDEAPTETARVQAQAALASASIKARFARP